MITAIIQARMGSSRLPGKVMKPLKGRPMIAHVLARVKACPAIEQVVLATTSHEQDTPLAEFALSQGVGVFRGSEDDVLDRYYQAAKQHGATVILRLTGDCPLLDPAVIGQTLAVFLSGPYDYANNFMQRTYPDGLDTEVMSFATLQKAWIEARLPSEREHVTPYLYKHPELFRQLGLTQTPDRSSYRWTVDEPADFEFVQAIYNRLYPQDPLFGSQAIYQLLQQEPDLLKINQGIPSNEGYAKSLALEQMDYKAFRDLLNQATAEIRTPLNAIMGYSELLLTDKSDNLSETQRQYAERISISVGAIYKAIEQGMADYREREQAMAPHPHPHIRFYDEVREFVHDALIPLTAVRGYADLLLRHVDGKMPLTEKEQRHFLQIIKSNGTTLAAFILNMGEIVRFEKDPNLKLTAVHAGEVLQHFHKNLRERGEAPKRGMQVKLELQENLPPMRADNDRLHRILQRLIDNALAYTPNGGQITLKAAADGDTGGVVLAVEDNGVGINPNDYERIFKRYERGHIPDKLGMIPGAGMGLSIAEMYTRAHGGKIWFESELDRGTTFYVQIPTYHTK